MRATVMYRAGDVRIENVPDARIVNPTDAVIRVTRACICGSDLWPYKEMAPDASGRPMGHEAIGVVEAVGADVRKVKVGNLVVMPFAYSDGTCEFCHEEIGTPALVWCEYGDGGISLTAIAEHDPRTLFTSRLYRHWHTGCLPHALVSHTALAA